MPSISAPAAIENFAAGNANVLIPVMGTGIECDLMCGKIPRHCAVFTHDADPVNVKLALHVTDLVGHFQAGRLILLTFDPIEQTLPAFLAAHQGYDFPHRMLIHPAIDKAELERFRSSCESAAAVTTERQFETAQAVAVELSARPAPVLKEPLRVAVLSGDPRPGSLITVRHLTNALEAMGWPAAVQMPSSPAKCHNLARLLLIRDHQPDLVLLFNCCTGRVTSFIPSDQPVASWFSWDSMPVAALAEGCGSGHHLFATTPGLCDQLCKSGAAAEQVHLLEAGVDTTTYKSVEVDPQRRERLACDVAVFADAVDGSAEAVGIQRDSQRILWNEIRRLTASCAYEYTSASALGIVIRAERGTGVKMTTDQVREKFVNLVRYRLAKTAMVGAVVADLSRTGFSVKVWGTGWSHNAKVSDLVVGSIPDPHGCNEVYQCATCVIFPFFDAETGQAILEVVAAGGQAIFKTPENNLDSLHPQTAEALNLLPQYRHLTTLITRVREAGVVNSQCASNNAKARQLVIARHTLNCRWRAIAEVVRR